MMYCGSSLTVTEGLKNNSDIFSRVFLILKNSKLSKVLLMKISLTLVYISLLRNTTTPILVRYMSKIIYNETLIHGKLLTWHIVLTIISLSYTYFAYKLYERIE